MRHKAPITLVALAILATLATVTFFRRSSVPPSLDGAGGRKTSARQEIPDADEKAQLPSTSILEQTGDLTPTGPLAGKKKVILTALIRLHEFRCNMGPPESESADFGTEIRLMEEYADAAFQDADSMRALLELVRELSDEKVRDFACDFFDAAFSHSKGKRDPDMLRMLLQQLEEDGDTEGKRRQIIASALVNLDTSMLRDEEIRLIIKEHIAVRQYTRYCAPSLLSILENHLDKPEVRAYFLEKVVKDGDEVAATKLSRSQLDQASYEALTSLLHRNDKPDLQFSALGCMTPGTKGGTNNTAANPMAVDYLGKLRDLYSKTTDPDVRSTVLSRMADFDMEGAASAMESFLRDAATDPQAKSQALEYLVSRSDRDGVNLYPNSMSAWLIALQSVGNDSVVPATIRMQAYVAWLAVQHAHRKPAEAMKEECRRVVSLLENDPDPQVKAAGADLKARAMAYGIY